MARRNLTMPSLTQLLRNPPPARKQPLEEAPAASIAQPRTKESSPCPAGQQEKTISLEDVLRDAAQGRKTAAVLDALSVVLGDRQIQDARLGCYDRSGSIETIKSIFSEVGKFYLVDSLAHFHGLFVPSTIPFTSELDILARAYAQDLWHTPVPYDAKIGEVPLSSLISPYPQTVGELLTTLDTMNLLQVSHVLGPAMGRFYCSTVENTVSWRYYALVNNGPWHKHYRDFAGSHAAVLAIKPGAKLDAVQVMQIACVDRIISILHRHDGHKDFVSREGDERIDPTYVRSDDTIQATTSLTTDVYTCSYSETAAHLARIRNNPVPISKTTFTEMYRRVW